MNHSGFLNLKLNREMAYPIVAEKLMAMKVAIRQTHKLFHDQVPKPEPLKLYDWMAFLYACNVGCLGIRPWSSENIFCVVRREYEIIMTNGSKTKIHTSKTSIYFMIPAAVFLNGFIMHLLYSDSENK
jgi:hypothetical protein